MGLGSEGEKERYKVKKGGLKKARDKQEKGRRLLLNSTLGPDVKLFAVV